MKELEDTLAENFANSGDGKRQPPAPPIPPVATRARRAANFDAESWLQLRKDDSGPWPWLEPRQETQAVQQDMPPPPPNEGENENGDEVDFGLEMEDENARAARLREQARAELRGKKALFLMSEAPAHRIRCHVSLVLDRPTDLVNHYLAGPDWHRRNWAREEGVGYLKWWLQELFPDYAPNVSDYQGVFRIDWRRGETTGVQMGMEWRVSRYNSPPFRGFTSFVSSPFVMPVLLSTSPRWCIE